MEITWHKKDAKDNMTGRYIIEDNITIDSVGIPQKVETVGLTRIGRSNDQKYV
jgi:hypothetical protein